VKLHGLTACGLLGNWASWSVTPHLKPVGFDHSSPAYIGGFLVRGRGPFSLTLVKGAEVQRHK